MEQITTRVPLLEAAKRAEALIEFVNEGVDVENELTKELVEQIGVDLASAVDRRWFLITSVESQMEQLKRTKDLISAAIKNREKVLESVRRTTTLALQQFPNIKAEGEFCKVSVKKCPVSLVHTIPVKSKSFSNMIAPEDTTEEMKPYLKTVTFQVLDTEHLKESLLIEQYPWATLEQKTTCQFRSK